MAAPVINTTQSVLGYLQNEAFAFQPLATNTPTSWTSSALPSGLAIDGGTGEITGAVTAPGVYVFELRATNADGTSLPVAFTLGIEASSIDPSSVATELNLDIASGLVTAPGITTGALFSARRYDDKIFRVTCYKNGVIAAVTLTALTLVLKELAEDPVEVTSSAFSSLGGGVFLVYASIDSTSLADSLDAHAADAGTFFTGLFELQWLCTTGLGVGPTHARGSSQTFTGIISRDIAP